MSTSNTSTAAQGAWFAAVALAALAVLPAHAAGRYDHDLVIQNGLVVDPERRTEQILDVGIRGDRIVALSKQRLAGKRTIDATGLVVAPGFVDLHAHGQSTNAQAIQALDGVTTALDMEAGAFPVADFYERMSGKAVINFGVSVSQQCARQVVLDRVPCPVRSPVNGSSHPTIDIRRARGNFAAATPEEVAELVERVRTGLDEGALGIGVGLEYTPGASRAEILELFRLSAERRAPIHVHVRRRTPDGAGGVGVAAAQEVIANAAITGAPAHLVHVASTGQKDTANIVRIVKAARQRGIDITTEAYPYTAGSTRIGSAVFDPGWQSRWGISYPDVQWVATGERLTEESFNRYREQNPSGSVILHMIAQSDVDAAVTDPEVMIASDGASWVTGGEHPRGAGTFSRMLGHYVRDTGAVSLVDAIRKMSWLPAQRLAEYVPAMRAKGRLRPGADADVVVFDPATVADRATYDKPMVASTGVRYVVVNGTLVVDGGELVRDVFPGRGVRREPTSGAVPGRAP